MVKAGCIIVALVIATSAHAGIGFCSEPSEPNCLNFGDIDEFCRSQVEQYLREIAKHMDCILENDRKSQQIAINKWNCRIKGNSYCSGY